MGCEISQSDGGSISHTQQVRMMELRDDLLAKACQNNTVDRVANAKEVHDFRALIGKMLYLGRISHPLLLFHASSMATKMNSLHILHLRTLCSRLKFSKKSNCGLSFIIPMHTLPFQLEVMSDASMSEINESGARGGFLVVCRCGDAIHPIQWAARQLRRVARSSANAELLAAGDAVSSVLCLQVVLTELNYHHDSTLLLYSLSLVSLSTSIR